ncbi:hypothetical protein NUU61_007341 [Penicillium alfredii]|uniref:O-methyltransferase C-terminal domain-containing protein n=1 Tax=Penicillium alfredii TaxID=1506179 RepID=A0A9W9F2V8_9EURO|nr:uncharacterized protein NUU61_007341 [Penicillium alfredii]KAJ5092471.1 hypothetical protein NUU61_007341 [Penicillium alfredii]
MLILTSNRPLKLPRSTLLSILGFFCLLSKARGVSGSLCVAQLADGTGADRDFIAHIMPVVSSLGFCSSSAQDVYSANEMTAVVAQIVGNNQVSSLHNTKRTLDPGRSLHQNRKMRWFELYPIGRLLGHGVPYNDTIFLVDIYGGQCDNLRTFKARFPYLPGRMVLQDIPVVVEGASSSESRIEVMSHILFDPQALKGARAYLFGSVFQNWPDHICRQILRNTIAAMASDHSCILIMDFLHDPNSCFNQTSYGFRMDSIGAGVVRTEVQWKDLLSSAGLRITGIWNQDPGMETLIEGVPAGRDGAR